MFQRLLIANRGEIAVRIVRSCETLGIETVAVYSEADRHARHVLEADAAVAIGEAPAARSYLSIPRLIDAARASGADAVHPGYGFLSENADFATACAEAGLTFVGPSPEVIARFGSKIEALRRPILERYEREGSPYYSTARLWDDGVVSPARTRDVLGLGLAVAYRAPIPKSTFGVFRM